MSPGAPAIDPDRTEPKRSIGVRALTVLGLALVGAYAVRAATGWGGAAVDAFFLDWVYDGVTLVAVLLCAWRAVRVRDDRTVWSLIAVAFSFELTGNVVETLLSGASTAPVPSAADAFWVAFYVPMIVALWVRGRATTGNARALGFDVLIATCALGSASAAIVLDPILAGGARSTLELITTLAYPVADLLLVALVIQLAGSTGWRLGRQTGLMAASFVILAVTDTVFAYQTARGTYVGGGLLDLGWLVPYALFGVAAWMAHDAIARVPESPGWRALAVPVGFAVLALAMVVYGGMTHIDPVAVALGASSLVFVIGRFAVTFRSYLAALAKTRLILETARDAFISFDADGRITDWNPEAEAAFGWSRHEVLGRDLAATIIPERRREAHRESVREFLDTDGGAALCPRAERTMVARDGREFPVERTLSPLATETGWTFNVFMRDITEQRRVQEELALARDDALEASRMKSIFVANMSHEIRTPMNGVIGMAEVLLGTDLDPEQTEYVETISASGDVLLEIIDDILDLSKIEAGKLELDPIDFDLGDAIERACGLLAARAHNKGLELTVAIEPELPVRVVGDAARLRQVIANFVSNAIKFTSTGEIVVAASAVSRTADGILLRLEVSDTGIGIDADTLSRLFTPFSQADSSTTRKYGGTGLGLAISRQLVELMRGRVGAASRQGEGSRFWFEVPLATAESADPAPGIEHDTDGMRVLVVDDNVTSRAAIGRALRAWRLDCDVAANAAQATQMVESASAAGEPYALVLVDMQMPDADGRGLGRTLRAQPSMHAARLVLLKPAGAHLDAPEDPAVFDGSLTKPVRRARLYTEVRAAIAGDRPAAHARDLPIEPDPDAEPATATATDATAPDAGRCVLIVEDTKVNQIVASLMLKKFGYRSQVAADGREALVALSDTSFAAALMDCQMPVLDGYETTREIRRREQGGRRMPIIAMTANSMQGERERCLAAGMDDYLTKPLRDRTLQDALARWISGPPSSAGTPEPNGAGGTPQDEVRGPLLDDDALAELDNVGPELLGSLVSLYSAEAAANVSDLRSAVDRAELSSIARTAHKLKGASGAVGAADVARLAAELETSAKAGDLTRAGELVGALGDRLDETLLELAARAERSADPPRTGS